jgi:hypothetical protein
MNADYLPKHATDIEACDWLKAQTRERWTLARLLENGLMPWFWLDYKPGYPAIFGDHIEGYLAPMVFTGDTQRLEADGSHALVNMTRTYDGVVMKVEPGITVSIKELRFKREDLQALSSALKNPAPTVAEVAAASSKPGRDGKAATNWKLQVQIETTDLFKRLRKAGASPTVQSTVYEMAKWCRDNNVKTRNGIYPSANYLRTHVLGGKHWNPPN